MIGLFEGKSAIWNLEKIPENFSFGSINPNWERITPYLERAMNRIPCSFEIGISNFFCGPESFTTDLSPLIGEIPEIRKYFIAAGLNSIDKKKILNLIKLLYFEAF